ncbi:MAG: transcription termination/antitermination protein NusG [Nannocystaceae bacterium]
MEWYIVNTFSGYENTVKRAIEERIKSAGLDEMFASILVPSEQVTQRRGARTVKTTKKFFPGYLFIEMELAKEAWHLVKNTPKVSGFLGGNTPSPVPRGQIDKMMGRTQPAVEDVAPAEESAAPPSSAYRVGEQVRVKTGAFANFTGGVEEVNADKHKIWLSVSIFGRPTRVEVDFTEVEPVA